jgi:hypothetical protein
LDRSLASFWLSYEALKKFPLTCLTTAGTQLLISESASNILTNTLGILVTIACSRLFRLALYILEVSGIRSGDPRAPESFAWRNFRAGLDAMWQGAIHLGPRQTTPHAQRREALVLFGIGLSLSVVFVGFLSFGVLTALLATSDIALSRHPSCGLYLPQFSAWPYNLNTSMPYESSVQAESAALAQSCLNTDNPDCGAFIDPAYSVFVENSSCPFEPHMCYGQGVSPIRITTGAISARKIGINSPGLLEFNRTAVCSPLNMNRTFINLASQEGNKYTFGYYYGHSDEWTTASYKTVRRGDRGDVPTYHVG